MQLFKRVLQISLLAGCCQQVIANERQGWDVMISSWDYDPSGTVTDQGNGTDSVDYDVDSDLNMRDGQSNYTRISWENPNNKFVNFAFFTLDVETNGGCTADNVTRECTTASGGGGGILPPIGGATTTEITAHAEASAPTFAWWNRFSNDRVAFDLGVSLSWIEGNVNVRTESDPVSDDDFDALLPALYAGLKINITDGVTILARGNGVNSGDNSLVATEYGVRLHTTQGQIGVGIEFGQREFDIQANDTDNGDKVNIKLAGSYFGLALIF